MKFAKLPKNYSVKKLAMVSMIAAGFIYVLYSSAIMALVSNEITSETGTWVPVQEAAQAPVILVNGTIEAKATTELFSGFEAIIKKVYKAPGEKVAKGEIILTFDDSEIRQQSTEAEAALLQAEKRLTDVTNWQSSSSYKTATRQKLIDQRSLDVATENAAQTKRLFKAGIVSRTELYQSEQDLLNAQVSLDISNSSVQELEARGSTLRIAQLEFEQQKTRSQILKQKLSKTDIRAPVSGVLMKFNGAQSLLAAAIEEGVRVDEGTLVAKVADLSEMKVKATVSETNIVQLEIGQYADIYPATHSFLNLLGKVTLVSRLPNEKSFGFQASERSVSLYDVEIGILPLADASISLYPGSNADVYISLSERPAGLLVPLDAIDPAAAGTAKLQIRSADGAVREIEAQLGETTLDSIHVLHPELSLDDDVFVQGEYTIDYQ